MTTRYLICGGRKFNDRDLMEKALKSLILHPEDAHVIHGGATGADTLAGFWAKDHGVPVTEFHADWDAYQKAAGPIRNRTMLDEGKPDVVIAFPGGRGTKNMVSQARDRRLVVITVMGENGDWFGQVSK